MHGGWKMPALCYDSTTKPNQSHLRWGYAPWTNKRMYQQDVSRQVWAFTGTLHALLLLLASPSKPDAMLLGASVNLWPLDCLCPSLWYGNA